MKRKYPRVDFVELHILHHAQEQDLYGLWMIEELGRHGYQLNASQLYPKFHRLERNGLLRRLERVVHGKRRKYYRLTQAGRLYFREQKERLMELAGEALSAAEIRKVLEMRLSRDAGREGRER